MNMKTQRNAHLNFMFSLPNVKILDKKRTFSVKNEQEVKYVKRLFLVSKRLIQFLNKIAYNFFLHDKGTRNLYN